MEKLENRYTLVRICMDDVVIVISRSRGFQEKGIKVISRRRSIQCNASSYLVARLPRAGKDVSSERHLAFDLSEVKCL
jgi:hypothetical protein